MAKTITWLTFYSMVNVSQIPPLQTAANVNFVNIICFHYTYCILLVLPQQAKTMAISSLATVYNARKQKLWSNANLRTIQWHHCVDYTDHNALSLLLLLFTRCHYKRTVPIVDCLYYSMWRHYYRLVLVMIIVVNLYCLQKVIVSNQPVPRSTKDWFPISIIADKRKSIYDLLITLSDIP